MFFIIAKRRILPSQSGLNWTHVRVHHPTTFYTSKDLHLEGEGLRYYWPTTNQKHGQDISTNHIGSQEPKWPMLSFTKPYLLFFFIRYQHHTESWIRHRKSLICSFVVADVKSVSLSVLLTGTWVHYTQVGASPLERNGVLSCYHI